MILLLNSKFNTNMTMKTIITLLLLTNIAFSQSKFIVLDSLTKKPIPYINAWSGNDFVGFSSDKNGKIKIKGNDKNLELTFFSAAYKLKKIKLNEINKVVLLQPKETITDKSVVLKKEVENYLPGKNVAFSFKNKFLSPKGPIIIAQYVPFSSEMIQTPFLNKLEFGINLTKKDIVYKIRFFNVDKNLQPSTELISKEITQVFKKSAYLDSNGDYVYKEVNNQVDLSNYKIKIPTTGLFISIEVLQFENMTKKTKDKNGKEHKSNLINLLVEKDENIIQYIYQNSRWNKDESESKIIMKISLTN